MPCQAIAAAPQQYLLCRRPKSRALLKTIRVNGRLALLAGTNSEPSTIGGSICAERAALCKLREATDCKRVTKVVVVSDSPTPLAPGASCSTVVGGYALLFCFLYRSVTRRVSA